jgi:hypothetical protein
MVKIGTAKKKQPNKIWYICTEGEKTEPEYFSMLQKDKPNGVTMKIFTCGGKTSVNQILNIAKVFLKKKKFNVKLGDRAFIVIDVDNNKPKDFKELCSWENKENGCHLLISNPCFEYWLLLHLEHISGYINLNKCMEFLKIHIPKYNKEINETIFYPKVNVATERAEKIESQNKDVSILERNGSTVFMFVHHLIGKE